jgi:spore coat protein U-like protein
MKYGLFRDVTRLLPWGQGANALGGLYLLNMFGAWNRTTVYGRIDANQTVPSGAYSDSPAIVVTY